MYISNESRFGRRQLELRRGRNARVVLTVGVRSWPTSAPREPTATERKVHELPHFPPKQWCSHCVCERVVEKPHKQVRLERSESIPPPENHICLVLHQDVGEQIWNRSDPKATFWVLFDVDMQHKKAILAPAKTASDRMGERAKRLMEQFFRGRVD